MIKTTKKQKVLAITLIALCIITLLPGSIQIPVKGASSTDWNKDTFWYEPWGVSGVHKGIDIFAAKATEITSPVFGIVLYTGEINVGGKVVVTLDAKLRLHYFAHLDEIDTHIGSFANTGTKLGSVGDTGNAAGKQPHLHYSLVSILPYVWRIDGASQGWKKMFYLDPASYFTRR